MKAKLRKRLEKAASILREVFDELENEDQNGFDKYGETLDNLATEIEDIVAEDERAGKEPDGDEEESYWDE